MLHVQERRQLRIVHGCVTENPRLAHDVTNLLSLRFRRPSYRNTPPQIRRHAPEDVEPRGVKTLLHEKHRVGGIPQVVIHSRGDETQLVTWIDSTRNESGANALRAPVRQPKDPHVATSGGGHHRENLVLAHLGTYQVLNRRPTLPPELLRG